MSLSELFREQEPAFPPVSIICSFLGCPRHQCLRCPLALGCAARTLRPFRDLARRRLWPLSVSFDDLKLRTVDWHENTAGTCIDHHYLDVWCVDAILGVVFHKISLPTTYISVDRPPPAYGDLHSFVRRSLGLGFRPGTHSSLTYLEKAALKAALYGSVEVSTSSAHISRCQQGKQIRIYCSLCGPHFQLRSLRKALAGRFYCFFCLAEETNCRCRTCKRRICSFCAISTQDGVACLGCAFDPGHYAVADRTGADLVKRTWYLG